jgi:hypothetical protein
MPQLIDRPAVAEAAGNKPKRIPLMEMGVEFTFNTATSPTEGFIVCRPSH